MKTLKRREITVRRDDAPLLAACSIVLKLANACAFTTSWGHTLSALADGDPEVLRAYAKFQLTPDQQQLLTQFAAHLAPVQLNPLVTIAVCPECGAWMYCSRRPPGRCRLTDNCPGTMTKASPAKSGEIVCTLSADDPLPELAPTIPEDSAAPISIDDQQRDTKPESSTVRSPSPTPHPVFSDDDEEWLVVPTRHTEETRR